MTKKQTALAARVEKHRKEHKLVQTWVSPKLYEVIQARAQQEGRPLANLVRRELEKIFGESA